MKKDINAKGAILQRDRETYAIAPHIPGGITSTATLRKICDVADKYNRAIRKGVPSSTTLPALRVSRSANQLVLSWPLSGPGFVLEMSRTLGPGASWESLGAGTVMSIGFAVTNDPGLPALFYRLRR